MRYIEAPAEYTGSGPALFLAGGISDAENWQQTLVGLLPRGEFVVLNPRRTRFPHGDLAAEAGQIEWEHRHLMRSDLVAFWFPPQTLCPIALFELGSCCAAGTSIVLGTHPDYARRFDVETHLRLRRPQAKIVQSLEELAEQVAKHFRPEGTLP
jgi:hypothetical protein